MFKKIKNYLRHKETHKYLEIVGLINGFYLCKTQNRVEAERQIKQLKIHNIQIKRNTVKITLERIGVLIGKQGANYNQLKNWIENKLERKIKLQLIESKYICYLGNYYF